MLPHGSRGKESKVNWTKTLPLLLAFYFFFLHATERAGNSCWGGRMKTEVATAATTWLYRTAVSYGFRVNNFVCLTMTAFPLCRCPYPHPHPASTRLPRAPLPSPDSCSHCSRLLCLPNALLGCMAVRLDHQKVTMQDQSQLWPVSWFQLLTASNK